MKPRALIVHATGTNRDHDVARALQLAGASPEIVHINALGDGTARLLDYQMMVLPGGFSYGDDLGAGKLWAVALRARLGDDLEQFVARGKPVIGICNGFQALVKSGLLPAIAVSSPTKWSEDEPEGTFSPPTKWGESTAGHRPGAGGPAEGNVSPPTKWGESTAGRRPGVGGPAEGRYRGGFPPQQATLTRNESGRFECRWVELIPEGNNIWTLGLAENIYCPVAHGEGRFLTTDETLAAIEKQGLVAVRYAASEYPENPNGSMNDIAGITNPGGNVLGLMPHPENHIAPEQHPQRHRGVQRGLGLGLFENGVRHAGQI